MQIKHLINDMDLRDIALNMPTLNFCCTRTTWTRPSKKSEETDVASQFSEKICFPVFPVVASQFSVAGKYHTKSLVTGMDTNLAIIAFNIQPNSIVRKLQSFKP